MNSPKFHANKIFPKHVGGIVFFSFFFYFFGAEGFDGCLGDGNSKTFVKEQKNPF